MVRVVVVVDRLDSFRCHRQDIGAGIAFPLASTIRNRAGLPGAIRNLVRQIGLEFDVRSLRRWPRARTVSDVLPVGEAGSRYRPSAPVANLQGVCEP